MDLKPIANFLFEVGMLKKTPRSGFQFLGTGGESVADHSLRCAVIGYTLANIAGDHAPEKVALMCLFHDLAESRTGDLNYVNKKYVQADEEAAVNDMTAQLPFGDEIRRFSKEFNERKTRRARLAHDADQLELILQLKELGDLGNPYCKDWISSAVKRLMTEPGQRLAKTILGTEFCDWWFEEKEDEWWVNGGQQVKEG
ncbi:HD family hydrolase [Thermodesulfobacteriota bacterium]